LPKTLLPNIDKKIGHIEYNDGKKDNGQNKCAKIGLSKMALWSSWTRVKKVKWVIFIDLFNKKDYDFL